MRECRKVVEDSVPTAKIGSLLFYEIFGKNGPSGTGEFVSCFDYGDPLASRSSGGLLLKIIYIQGISTFGGMTTVPRMLAD